MEWVPRRLRISKATNKVLKKDIKEKGVSVKKLYNFHVDVHLRNNYIR